MLSRQPALFVEGRNVINAPPIILHSSSSIKFHLGKGLNVIIHGPKAVIDDKNMSTQAEESLVSMTERRMTSNCRLQSVLMIS
jgi:hypothetical protein